MIYPRHIAIIPDGNRTWAKMQGLPSFIWHAKGFDRVVELTKYIFTNTPIEALTVWWLSTENLKNRSKEELDYLFDIYKKWWKSLEEFLQENKINFKWVGSEKWLPQDLVDYLRNLENKYKFDVSKPKWCVVAVNYGGRDEIIRWINKLLHDFSRLGPRFYDEIDEELFSKYLDFADLPPIDLVIRTKWKMAKRLSWFMLWWIWYAELYFTDKFFPDFDVDELNKALKRFNEITKHRNFGK